MSSVGVVNYLLSNAAAVIAEVPAASIKTGALSQGSSLPAIGIRQVSGIERLPVSLRATHMRTDRVQVTVYAASYAAKKTILGLVRAALAGQRGSINSVDVEAILPDGIGPDIDEIGDEIFEQSQDFVVKWHEA